MAQTPSTADNCCLKTELTLAALAGNLYPAIRETETFGTLQALMEGSGRNGLEQLNTGSVTRPGDVNCTDRTVKVKYEIPRCETAAACTVDFAACDDVTSTPEDHGYDSFTIEECVDAQFSISLSDFDCTCASTPSEDLARKMQIALRRMKKGMNEILICKAYSAMGNYYTDAGDTPVSSLLTPRTLNIFNESNGTAVPQPLAFFSMIEELQRQGLGSERPTVISGTPKLRAYEFAGTIFDGNLDGADTTATRGLFNGYTDYELDRVITTTCGGTTTNNLLTLIPGSFHVAEWFTFETTDKQITGDRVTWAPTFVSPSGTLFRQKIDLGSALGNMPFVVDMQVRLSECQQKLVYQFKKYFDFWCIPQEAFAAECNQAHNYKTLWTVDCGPLTCADLC